jgi:hypothetical protein
MPEIVLDPTRLAVYETGAVLITTLTFSEPHDTDAVRARVVHSLCAWAKRLENPRHDDLSAERITDPSKRVQGQRAFERLAKQVRARIRELAKAEPTSKMELDELNDFFASDQTRQETAHVIALPARPGARSAPGRFSV